MVFAYFCAIYIYICMIIRSVKVQDNTLACVITRQGKALAVPSCTTRHKSGLCFVGVGRLLCDTEVVWKI